MLDAGNSGSTIRMLSGILAAQAFVTRIGGDESLSRRPMERIMKPLAQMGARIEAHENRFPPLTIHGGQIHPMEYTLPMASAQVKSCVLLAGLFAEGRTTVHEPVRTRDHTELALREFGADVEIERRSITVTGRPRLQGRELRVPGDLSAAAFFLGGSPDRSRIQPHDPRRGAQPNSLGIARFPGGNGRANQDPGCDVNRRRAPGRRVGSQITRSRRDCSRKRARQR